MWIGSYKSEFIIDEKRLRNPNNGCTEGYWSYQWFLFSDSVRSQSSFIFPPCALAESRRYRRKGDATRYGKRVAKKLRIDFIKRSSVRLRPPLLLE